MGPWPPLPVGGRLLLLQLAKNASPVAPRTISAWEGKEKGHNGAVRSTE